MLSINMFLLFTGDNEELDSEHDPPSESCDYTYNHLKDLDPVAANRIHPNDQRKVRILSKMLKGSYSSPICYHAI